jgi:hypothetical protein
MEMQKRSNRRSNSKEKSYFPKDFFGDDDQGKSTPIPSFLFSN